MNVLVACEESQRVCSAFRAKGHNAFSCDILPCSGGHPEWHIQGDVLALLDQAKRVPGLVTPFYQFHTQDGNAWTLYGNWDLIIAHPPCTFLTRTGNRWFNVEKYGDKARERARKREEAIKFFMHFVEVDCPRIAIENPIGYMSTRYRKPDQIIQPYQFGHHARKPTCLWLKGLPLLQPVDIVDPGVLDKHGLSEGAAATCARDENGKILSWNDPRTAIIRSRTYTGIAKAMADQWG